VRPAGVVIGNIWGRGANPLFEHMVRTYQEVFDELYMLDVPTTTNKILLALPRKQSLDRAALIERARKTGAAHRFPFDLGAIDEHQFHNLGRTGKTGRVLRDAEVSRSTSAR
jgi:hypothetical protein